MLKFLCNVLFINAHMILCNFLLKCIYNLVKMRIHLNWVHRGRSKRKPDRPAGEELHATGGKPDWWGLGLGLGLWPYLGGLLAWVWTAWRQWLWAGRWRAVCCAHLPSAVRGCGGGNAWGQGCTLSPGTAAAGRALCPGGPGAWQLPRFHLPLVGPCQTPALRPRYL